MYASAISKYLPTGTFKWINPKMCDLDKYSNKFQWLCFSSWWIFLYVLVNLEYPKELCELRNNYILGPGKIEVKKQKVSSYQLFVMFM